jgi:ABC-type polar amino acid transport system ATPase subunit
MVVFGAAASGKTFLLRMIVIINIFNSKSLDVSIS